MGSLEMEGINHVGSIYAVSGIVNVMMGFYL